MKVYMKSIKMLAVTEENGILTPIRFQMKDESKELITVKIDNICLREEERLAGNKMLIFKCQSIIYEVVKVYELKYEISTCKWYLYKM